MSRLDDLVRFYALLDRLAAIVGGPRRLPDIGRFRDWPRRGVYFFFEPSERRSDSGDSPRVVRVGTHALTDGSGSTLRQRLGQHAGRKSGGGNHRGSIFRLLVGQALIARGSVDACVSWGVKSDLGKASLALGVDRQQLAALEAPVEEAVSRHLAQMSFLWLDISDEPGPESLRGVIERSTIALLSNADRPELDPSSVAWLGRHSDRDRVWRSGLWNQRHVEETHDPSFLDVFEHLIESK